HFRRLVGREHQVLGKLLLGQQQVFREPVIAHVLQRVAAEAVVDEVLGAALQGGGVRQVVARPVQFDVGARRHGAEGRQGKQKAGNYSFHQNVTLSGTGFDSLSRVNTGSSRKIAR